MSATRAETGSRSPYARDAALGVHAISLEPDPSLRGDPVDPDVARLLPERACRHFRMLAVATAEDTITLAVADAGNELAVEVARALGGRPIELVLAPSDQIERAIDRAFAGTGAERAAETGAPAAGRLGGILVQREAISAEALADALETQSVSGGRLGEILRAGHDVGEEAICEALADQLRVPLVDLEGLEPDERTLALVPEGLQRRGRCLPLETDGDTLYVAVADPLDSRTYDAISERTDLRVRIHMALPSQLDRLLRRLHRDGHLRSARAELLSRDPAASANRVLSAPQRLAVLLAAAAIAAGFALAAATAAIVTGAVSAALVVPPALYWAALAARAGSPDSRAGARSIKLSGQEIDAIDERLLPRYSVVVPLFEASAPVAGLLDSLRQLDYPAAKLEVLLVARPGDRTTIEAVRAAEPPPWVRVLTFADSGPGRSAAACNYGLQQASGRFVAVLGPGERPPPDQLKRALLAFERGGPELACVQAALTCGESAGTGAAIGMASWFGAGLPGAAAGSGPLPLAGGGLHVDRDAVLEAGGWDPFNARPGIELGIRLQRLGHGTACIDSATLTSCGDSAADRMRRRAHLWRGVLQTYLIELRSPAALAGELGGRAAIAILLLLGILWGALLAPLLVAVVALWGADEAGLVAVELPAAVVWLCAGQLAIGLVAVASVTGRAARSAGRSAIAAVLVAPFRWAAASISAWRGLGQLLRRPFHP